MTAMIKRWLVRLGLWLARLGGWEESEIRGIVKGGRYVIPHDILDVARRAVKEQNERWNDMDGETKRAAVYRTLLNVFPGRSKRILSMAIEEAICLDC
jgi:hypothetical protein